jgi:hypothetical protein
MNERAHSIEEFREGYESQNRLRGFRSACGFCAATWLLACPRCGKRDLEEVDLSGRGTVAAFSVQNVPSDEFLNDAPYAYVIVDLEEGGRITGWIPGIGSESELRIGERVHFVPGYRPGVQFQKG